MKRLVLIDGINFFYRGAWSGVSGEMKTIHGDDMTYVLAYFRNLANLVNHFKFPTDENRYVICWDGGYDERLRISSEAVTAGLIPKAYKQERREAHDIEDEEEREDYQEELKEYSTRMSNQRDSTTMYVNKINRFLNGKPVRGM